MSGDKQATGRPKEQLPLVMRALVLLTLVLGFFELSLRFLVSGGLGSAPQLRFIFARLRGPLLLYVRVREFMLEHPIAASGLVLVAGALLFFAVRWWLLFWHNEVKARLSGTYLEAETAKFPLKKFDLINEIRRRPKGTTFVGMTRVQTRSRFGGWEWRPAYLTERQRSMHRHVLGRTGSGKTQSVLWPQVLQDLLDGKGCFVIDAKGSDENIATMKALAALAGRSHQLRVFALPAWSQPHLFSHSYNLVYCRPRSPTDRGGDPAATAERVFSVLRQALGNNEYYNGQGERAFSNLCRLLHGIVDKEGRGLLFTLADIGVCFKAIGVEEGPHHDALAFCLANSLDRQAATELTSQITRLGRDAAECFTGITGAIDKFLAQIANAYDPDIIFEDVLEKNLIVYAQMPANLHKLQAPAVGRAMLMDLQQEGSLRQVFRRERNQTPFAVTVDEFYNFADLSIVDSLNKLRDANIQFTLAHQSLADLELVSKEFATAVWDNTRTKDILSQDHPALCEQVAKCVGTTQKVERTVRRQQGALFTSLATGDASTKLVEGFTLHPNAIKGLAAAGQGYLYNDEGARPIAYSMLPPGTALFYDLPRHDQQKSKGLKLQETFVDARA